MFDSLWYIYWDESLELLIHLILIIHCMDVSVVKWMCSSRTSHIITHYHIEHFLWVKSFYIRSGMWKNGLCLLINGDYKTRIKSPHICYMKREIGLNSWKTKSNISKILPNLDLDFIAQHLSVHFIWSSRFEAIHIWAWNPLISTYEQIIFRCNKFQASKQL